VRVLYRFCDCEVDLDLYELRRAGVREPIEPQVFDVLVHLIRHRDRVVTKDELFDAVWETRFVSESALTSRVKAARRAVGDDGQLQRVIQTARGRGYRFVASVTAVDGPAESGGLGRVRMEALSSARSPLPSPLTRFIGREAERAGLVGAVRRHRLVTATGPGGVGKTRLAIAAGYELVDEFSGGVVFVDLVRVAHPEMIATAMADAAGVPERAGASRLDALIGALAEVECLVVVDNCEHVQDAARVCIERLLVGCPLMRVLATSRLRLMLPFEHVVAVPGMSLEESDGGSDATRLFVDRVLAAGGPPVGPDQWQAVTEICRGLDGMALAIELAAARTPGLGVDGLADALGGRLHILAIGSRADDRHRSLRAAIAWSYELLGENEQAVLRAASVFAAPFDVEAMGALTDRDSVFLLNALARLVDWNLVSLRAGPVSRYRVLETIRQFALDVAEASNEVMSLRAAHMAWCHATLTVLRARAPGDDVWCADVDQILDDARAALAWASDDAQGRIRAGALATVLADVLFQRGHPGEAQHRYEQAATWADTPGERRHWLRFAAGAASARNVGGDSIDLLQQAASVGADAGAYDDAAYDLANAAALQARAPGIIGQPVLDEDTEALLDRARAISQSTAHTEAAIAVAEGWSPGARARSRAHTDHALERAEAAALPLLINEALDQLTAVELDAADLNAAAAAIDQRLGLLERVPLDALSGFEYYDTYQMACRVSLASGRLDAARRYADAVASLPFLREQRHVGLDRRMEVDAMAGDFDAVITYSQFFEEDWRQAGRPAASNLASGTYAVAMVFGMVGDFDSRARWIDITRALFPSPDRLESPDPIWNLVFDAFLALHVDDPLTARHLLTTAPDDPVLIDNQNIPLWRPWYAAAWAEASVLTHHPDTSRRLIRAANAAVGNDIALTIIRRARLLHRHQPDELAAIAASFDTQGCTYQETRTRTLASSL
jgi:predicted ATPase/DNA-binding winged helix-turn-helix (wHTH) protein